MNRPRRSTEASKSIGFGSFAVYTAAGELRKHGIRIKLQDQPFRILTILLERPGEVVTREELREMLWPDGTFVEFEHSLNTSINKLRRALNDSADKPRYIETVPRRGYRFVGEIDRAVGPPAPRRIVPAAVVVATIGIAVVAGWWLSRSSEPARPEYTLRQLTFDSGITCDPMISADGKFVVYASDRAGDGNLDIWVQQVGADAAIQLTDHPARDHEPSFSADGRLIVFASSRDGGGIFVKPALGGSARRVHRGSAREPRFSPDGKWISFGNYGGTNAGIFVAPSEGGKPIELHPDDPRRSLILTPPIWLPEGAGILTGSNSQENWLILSPDGKDTIRTELHQNWLVERGFEWRIRAGAVDWYLMRPEAWWAARNRVIFTATHGASTNLWSVPLSPATGKVTGEPGRLTTGAGPDVCPSVARNGRIVFGDLSANLNIVSVPVDANTGEVTGPMTAHMTDVAQDEFPVISPDGSKIAYLSNRSGGHDIWIHDLETGDRQALTDLGDLHWQGGLAFSPDGSEVAFSRQQDATYIVPAKGGVPSKVVSEHRGVRDWSPDGEKLLIGRRVLDISTEELTELFEPGAFDLRVSPDGRWVAFHAFAGPDRRQIRVAPFHPDRTTPVEEAIPITAGEFNEYRAAWSPDGNLLYFSSERDGHNCIWAQKLDPRTKQPAGPPFEVQGFHETTPTLAHRSHGFWLSVAPGRIVFNIAHISGNVWMLEPIEEGE